MLNWADAHTEREREREREVCARWDSETSHSRGSYVTGDSQKWNKVWALFWREKSWQHCISISLTTGWAMGQTENTHCVNRTLIQLVLLKYICVNCLVSTFQADGGGVGDIFWHTLGALTYCCLSIISNQSAHSHLTSTRHFRPHNCSSLDIFLDTFSNHKP